MFPARDPERLLAAAESMDRKGIHVLALLCDVSRQGQVGALVRHIQSRYREAPILVPRAGLLGL